MNCQDLLWGAREYASNGSELCKNLGNFGTLDLLVSFCNLWYLRQVFLYIHFLMVYLLVDLLDR